MLDLIYILVFALLIFLINIRKRKKQQDSQKNQSLETASTPSHENLEKEKRLTENRLLRKNEGCKKSIFYENARKKEFTHETIDSKELPSQFTSKPVESHLAVIDNNIFSREESLLKDKEALPSNLDSIVDKAFTKDMVILSAIYFPPYI